MPVTRRAFTCGLLAATGYEVAAPLLHAVPTAPGSGRSLLQLQQEFLNLRFGMFIHLNMATYEQREWGDVDASPALFNPSRLDTDQWASAARSAGMGYGILTTKHHDGFCLWPTATSSPSVKDATFKGDIVRAYVDSFRRHGLQPCLYFSILDLRAAIRPYQINRQKIDLIKAQLTELLTHYGPIPAIVFDGWNAGWSRITYEQISFREIYDHIKALQPDCLVSDHNAGSYPGSALCYGDLKQYEQHAGQNIPADSLIPSQSGNTLQSDWFWKQSYPTEQLTTAAQIVDEWLIPFNKRHCNLVLNVAPNRKGRFDSNAVERLAEVGRHWENRQSAPTLTLSVRITTPNLAFAQPSFGSSSPDAVGPDQANDNSYASYWLCRKGQTSGWLEIAFAKPTAFNTLSIVEPRYDPGYGAFSRIHAYQLQYWAGSEWKNLANGQTPAIFQLHQFPRITASRVRVTLEGSTESPGLAEFGVYDEPV